MAKIEKFLRRLSYGERQIARVLLVSIFSGELSGLDVKKLKGHENIYRVRKGDIRIVFHQEKECPKIIFIGRRGDSKYKQF